MRLRMRTQTDEMALKMIIAAFWGNFNGHAWM
jgi:hypothetical protein